MQVKAFLFGLLAAAPLATAFNDGAVVEKRHIGSLASFASKMVRDVLPVQKRQAPDEFGPWDSTEDEFGSWVDKRAPHHTEQQIAAKQAAQAAQGASGSGSSGASGSSGSSGASSFGSSSFGSSSSGATGSTGSSGSSGSTGACQKAKRHHTE